MISNLAVRCTKVAVRPREIEMIGRKTFLFDLQCHKKMSYCCSMIPHDTVYETNATVRVGKVGMVRRETFLSNMQCLLIMSKCGGVISQTIANISDVGV